MTTFPHAASSAAKNRPTVDTPVENERLRQIVTMVPVAIVALDNERKVAVWNRGAEKIFGYSAAEVVGRPYPPVADGRRSELDELFARLSAGETVRDIELSQRSKDGKLVEVRLSATLWLDGAGKPSGALAVMEDVTDRKMIERQREHAERLEAVCRFTGGIAHDFNELLTVMMANLEILQDRVKRDTEAETLFDQATAAVERGAALVRQLQAFARKQPLEPTAFDLNELVCQVMDFFARAIGGEVDLQMSLADPLWPVLADATQVESVLIDLAINARDAMPAGGRLTVETANTHLDEAYAAGEVDVTPGDYVVLAVSDTGTGIAPEVLARVFDPFFTTGKGRPGSGLGLSMLYGLAKQSGGHVKVYSEVGHGTTVRLFLPRAATAAASDARHRPDGELAALPATILLVEDDRDVRRAVVNQLARLGHRVHVAEDAEEALTFLEGGEHIDLLFTDIIMPGEMTGIDLAAEARKRRRHLKVLFTTGFAEAFARNAGVSGRLLTKPYALRDLDRKVREALHEG